MPRYSIFESRTFVAVSGIAASQAAARDQVKTAAMRKARERPTEVMARFQAMTATAPATRAPPKRLRA